MIADREDIKLHMPVIEKLAARALDVVEIGPDLGTGSTRAIERGKLSDPMNDEDVWVTVDIDDHIIPECRPTFKNWFMVVGDSREQSTVDTVLSLLPAKPDLIFIDTIHEKAFLAKELAVWVQAVHDGTVWLFHDTWMLGKYNTMTDAIKEFAQTHPQWKYVDISTECNGLGALIPADMKLSDYGI